MNRKSFIGRALLGVGAMFSGIKLSEASIPLSNERQFYIKFLTSDWLTARLTTWERFDEQNELKELVAKIKDPNINLSDITMTVGVALFFMRKGYRVRMVGKEGFMFLKGEMRPHSYVKLNGESDVETSIEAGLGQWKTGKDTWGDMAELNMHEVRFLLPNALMPVPKKKKGDAVNWTNDQIKEAFRLQFGDYPSCVGYTLNHEWKVCGWFARSGSHDIGEGQKNLKSDFSRHGIYANTENFGNRDIHELTDSLRSYISELS